MIGGVQKAMENNQENRAVKVYVYWSGMENPVLMGVLQSDRLKGKEIFSFEYDDEWLLGGLSHPLAPNLQLFSGLHFQNEEQSNFGIFFDSSPDLWGRILMQRREAALARKENRATKKIVEKDYLPGVYDDHRMSALRFK